MYGTIFGRMPGFKPKLLLKAARCATIELPSAWMLYYYYLGHIIEITKVEGGEYKVELFICYAVCIVHYTEVSPSPFQIVRAK